MTNYPTAWQRRVIWMVITYLCIVAGGAVAVWLITLFGQAVGFLQPVLIPFALAAVLAFLIDPVVRLLTTTTRLSRTWAVLVVFVMIALLLGLLGVAVVPRIYDSTARMVQGMPAYTKRAQQRLTTLLDASEKQLSRFQTMFPGPKPSPSDTPQDSNDTASPSPAPDQGASPTPAPTASALPDASAAPEGSPRAQGIQEQPQGKEADAFTAQTVGDDGEKDQEKGGNKADSGDSAPTAEALFKPNGIRDYIQKQIPSIESRVPAVLDSIIHLIFKGLGWAGVLLDLIIIPVYLYFLLVESRNIARHWNEYLPIRDSPFKKEVVSCLLEINGYLVAFFRGQLLVSTIDGIIIGGSLALFIHLDFAFFIGLLVIVLTFIPYLGIILCYIPVILIAIIQYGDFWHPFWAVIIMFFAQTLESTIISPKIVGDSVGLHPVTVILSVFGWSLLLNGPIGAILAVPLSATIKVLLRRYIWEASGRGRHFMPLGGASIAALEDETRRAEEATQGKTDADGPRVAGAPVGPPDFQGTGKKDTEASAKKEAPAPVLGAPPPPPAPAPAPEAKRPGNPGIPSAGIPTPPGEGGPKA